MEKNLQRLRAIKPNNPTIFDPFRDTLIKNMEESLKYMKTAKPSDKFKVYAYTIPESRLPVLIYYKAKVTEIPKYPRD